MATLAERKNYERVVRGFAETADRHLAAMAGMTAEQQASYMMERIVQADIVVGLVTNVFGTLGLDVCFIKGEQFADAPRRVRGRSEAFRISGSSEAQLLIKLYSDSKLASDWRANITLTEGPETLFRVQRICTPAGRGTAVAR